MSVLLSKLRRPLALFVTWAALQAAATPSIPASANVYSFGPNAQGRTGMGTENGFTMVATPIDVSNLGGRSITQVTAGSYHNLLLAEDGAVFSFGLNEDGRTGVGTAGINTLVATPIDASQLGGRAIKQVAAGYSHSVLLAEDGAVFTFGANWHGQTGLGMYVGNALVATPIDASRLGGRAIKQVAAGPYANLLLAEDGSVFSFGWNINGRTGLGLEDGDTAVATPIDASNLGGRAIKQVSVGDYHSLLLAEDGSVFSFGDDLFGQTGLGTPYDFDDTVVATPIDASNLGSRAITQVAAGGHHSLLLADDGSVFTFGWNSQGATGLGKGTGTTPVATQIDARHWGNQAITQVAAGRSHSLLLAEDGSVFSFGSNGGGATGLGTDSGFSSIPTLIDMSNLGGRTITKVEAGWNHSLLLTVPEPGSLSLVGAAALACMGFLRSK